MHTSWCLRPSIAVVLVLLLAGCGGTSGSTDRAAPRRPLPPLPSAGQGGPRDAVAVGFRSADGTGLRGRLFGHGTVAVVLSHMGNRTNNESDWYPFARRLVSKGYSVLVYNRQGVCTGEKATYDCSSGIPDYASAWQDVVGAARFVRARGARSVALVGASIGGTSTVFAAQSGQVHPTATISLAGVNYISTYSLEREGVERIGGAKLFVAGRGDTGGPAKSAVQWSGWATPPKRLVLLNSDAHGTDMFAPSSGVSGQLTRVMLSFLTAHAPAGA